jgi:DNA-directed RNA polymerase subunit RPC12/RpoP
LFCSKCGNKLKEDAHFCSDCGAPVGFLNQSDGKKSSKKLDYVECPNCGAEFDNPLKFDLTKNWVALAKFRCTSCNRIFNYPVSKSYGLQIFLGLCSFLASFPVSETSVYKDLGRVAFGAILWLIGIGLLIQGVIGSIKNSRLKTEYPDWGNRFHNTVHSTSTEANNSRGK